MTIAGLLTALTILIPIMFSPIRIPVGLTFTATLAVHAPILIAMFISPWAAAFVAIGSAIGFFFSAPLVVAARAATHVIFAVAGAIMVQKMRGNGMSKLILVWLVTMALHAVFEAIVAGSMTYFAFEHPFYIAQAEAFTTGVGTLIHHSVDYVIMLVILAALSKAKLIDFKFEFKKKAAL